MLLHFFITYERKLIHNLMRPFLWTINLIVTELCNLQAGTNFLETLAYSYPFCGHFLENVIYRLIILKKKLTSVNQFVVPLYGPGTKTFFFLLLLNSFPPSLQGFPPPINHQRSFTPFCCGGCVTGWWAFVFVGSICRSPPVWL